ncbi:DNA excision repair protein ERCC-6-like [Frankliniella fusca]|uniref:DNA excision repair protein ERCC-6-like n=1 Tax=Frankliniella fusca TaxID=407009 RepID=A0AAE1HAW4_9NEOP|nr:DNA excision repair protein ERCC-6-like [Frankliniella fusca]
MYDDGSGAHQQKIELEDIHVTIEEWGEHEATHPSGQSWANTPMGSNDWGCRVQQAPGGSEAPTAGLKNDRLAILVSCGDKDQLIGVPIPKAANA